MESPSSIPAVVKGFLRWLRQPPHGVFLSQLRRNQGLFRDFVSDLTKAANACEPMPEAPSTDPFKIAGFYIILESYRLELQHRYGRSVRAHPFDDDREDRPGSFDPAAAVLDAADVVDHGEENLVGSAQESGGLYERRKALVRLNAILAYEDLDSISLIQHDAPARQNTQGSHSSVEAARRAWWVQMRAVQSMPSLSTSLK